mmetsp:Transcript_21351/g.57463  ORF Transcript_21351/g.57463 Transcript_21351/m.57463 type:complete len:284 (+) Transcript_21351:532-1383(+)
MASALAVMLATYGPSTANGPRTVWRLRVRRKGTLRLLVLPCGSLGPARPSLPDASSRRPPWSASSSVRCTTAPVESEKWTDSGGGGAMAMTCPRKAWRPSCCAKSLRQWVKALASGRAPCMWRSSAVEETTASASFSSSPSVASLATSLPGASAAACVSAARTLSWGPRGFMPRAVQSSWNTLAKVVRGFSTTRRRTPAESGSSDGAWRRRHRRRASRTVSSCALTSVASMPKEAAASASAAAALPGGRVSTSNLRTEPSSARRASCRVTPPEASSRRASKVL